MFPDNAYFQRFEFACKCGCGRVKICPSLVEALIRLRIEVGHPINVTSGYRCEHQNAAVGGKWTSYHLRGLAVDVQCRNLPFADFVALTRSFHPTPFRGLGIYTAAEFLHLDLRTRPTLWYHPDNDTE